MIQTTPHLNFRGTARSALAFYQSVFGGKLSTFTYRQGHNLQSEGGVATEDEADHLMWGQVQSDQGFRVMAYDVQAVNPYDPGERAYFVAVRSDSTDELTAYWTGLKKGAEIMVDLGPAPWGTPLYGMLKDQFGVIWVLDMLNNS